MKNKKIIKPKKVKAPTSCPPSSLLLNDAKYVPTVIGKVVRNFHEGKEAPEYPVGSDPVDLTLQELTLRGLKLIYPDEEAYRRDSEITEYIGRAYLQNAKNELERQERKKKVYQEFLKGMDECIVQIDEFTNNTHRNFLKRVGDYIEQEYVINPPSKNK